MISNLKKMSCENLLRTNKALSNFFFFFCLFSVYTFLALYTAGPIFIENMSSAIPISAVDGSLSFMTTGDHFEQFARYNLPFFNYTHDRPFYDSSFQYNLNGLSSNFSEGLVFFPFSFIHFLLTYFFEPVFAYNLISILSFPLTGIAGFLLAYHFTANRLISFALSLIVVCLPHRIAFLFGQMLYGVDLMFAALILLFTERYFAYMQRRNLLGVGLVSFFFLTSNFQSLYFFTIFFFPYVLLRIYIDWPSIKNEIHFKDIYISIIAAAPSFVYCLQLISLLNSSGLSQGQKWHELVLYSPHFSNMTQLWSGPEMTIYLGVPLLIAVCVYFLIVSVNFNPAVTEYRSPDSRLHIFFLLFLCGYLLSMGPNLDSILNLSVYKVLFDHFPLFDSTRTPGRIVGVASIFFVSFMAFAVKFLLENNQSNIVRNISMCAFSIIVVIDYDFANPSMVRLDSDNRAYEELSAQKDLKVVLPLPLSFEPNHHHHSTFLYYAQRNNLRIFSGHSSMYPSDWYEHSLKFNKMNTGFFNREIYEHLKKHDISHVAVHNTDFEPSVGGGVLSRYLNNPNFELVGEDNGVNVFRLSKEYTDFDIFDMFEEIAFTELATNKINYLDSWHIEESLSGKASFRWMDGNYSNIIFYKNSLDKMKMTFKANCPKRPLSVKVNGNPVKNIQSYGWAENTIILDSFVQLFLIEFNTPELFTVPTDIRNFGCMISNVEVQPYEEVTDSLSENRFE